MARPGLDEHRTGKQCVVGGRLTGDASGRQVRRSVFASEQSAEVYAAAAIERRPIPFRGCGRQPTRPVWVHLIRPATTAHRRTNDCRVCDGSAVRSRISTGHGLTGKQIGSGTRTRLIQRQTCGALISGRTKLVPMHLVSRPVG